ncbi:MAG: type II toxin-antitoxin system VapC family toxin [Nitrospirae bacterium]|nr:type II toxin-antitoxin system VapC family toxin [Nitrospirota bacterium]
MADRIVVDASVALKWQFKDELEAEQAIQMLIDFINGKIELISPNLFAYEVVNAVNIAVIKKRISEKEGLDAINDILAIGVSLFDFAGLVERTFRLARIYSRSVYDCAYLALAEKEGCMIYTADKRLFNALKDRIKFIRWVGDYGKLM